MKLSVRYKLLIPIIGVIVFGMAIATFLSYRSSANALNHAIVAELNTVTEGLTKQITVWLQDLKADLEIQSQQDLYSNMLWSEGRDSALVEKSNEAMKAFSDKYGFYETVAVTNAKGLVVASSRENLVGKLNVGDRQYFKDSLNGAQVLSDTLKSKVSGKPIFVLSAPMRVDGEIEGIILASVDLSVFSTQFIDPIKIGEEGYAYMAAQSGLLSAHPNKDLIMKTNLKEYDWGKELFDKKNGTMNYTFQDVEKIVSFHTEPTTGWLIGAGAAMDDIFGEVTAMRNQSLIVALLVILAVTAVVLLIVRPIVAAINKGVAFAETIQQGDLSQRLKLDREDEIGALSTALDTMADGLQQRATLAEAIAGGDLSQTVTLTSDKDVLGQALAKMTEKLNDILGQINIAGEQIDSGSTQVSDSSQELSHGATQQASAIEEIGASMGELSGQTRQNAENAASANQLANEARSAADRGAAQMQQMVSAMGEINEAGQSIGNIIKTIDEIAFQTNLLALNAAVEAARAGQHGKGFAVVAEEVRNLAARSAKAASETAELIEGSVKKGENGATIASQTAESLDEIVQAIIKTTDLVSEIAAASSEQAEGIGQINNGIGQVDQVIQRNTASAEEGAAAAEELSSQATHLRQMIAQFKLRNQAAIKVTTPTAQEAPHPPMPKAALTGWGGEPAVADNQPQIALDSEEFGKY